MKQATLFPTDAASTTPARRQPEYQQAELFAAREVAQFGVTANPQMPVTPATRLVLESEDTRTPEDRERDERQAVEEQTVSMFAEPEPDTAPTVTGQTPDLITVYDVWGKRCRVSRSQYESGKTMLRMYNQYGHKLHATDDRSVVCIHRANIARIVNPAS